MYWKYAPKGNLEDRWVQIAEGDVVSNSSRLEAVYCHSFVQSGGVLEITRPVAGLYWRIKVQYTPLYKKELKKD